MAILGQEVVDTVHPEYWPYCECASSTIYNYLGTSASSSAYASFYTNITPTFGAIQTTASKTADTYYTFLDITGSHGAMGTILFSKVASAATGFYTIKLTTDGVVEEFRTISTTVHDNYRQFIGFATDYAEYEAPSYGIGGYGGSACYSAYDGIRQFTGSATPYTVQMSLRRGTPVHQFNESLKVEVKCSLAGHASAYECNGTVFYNSAPNL